MRYIILFVILAVTLVTELVNGRENPQIRCLAETGATVPELAASLNQDVKKIDEKVKCYYACYMKQFKVMRDDGSIDTDLALKDLEEQASEASKKAMEKCITLSGDSICETAFLITTCVIKGEALNSGSLN